MNFCNFSVYKIRAYPHNQSFSSIIMLLKYAFTLVIVRKPAK